MATTTTTVKSVPIRPVVKVFIFNKDLKLNNISSDVQELQRYLNNHGYVLAKTGAGSKCKETTKFTQAIKNALVKFQKADKISPASGILDSNTRKVINKIK